MLNPNFSLFQKSSLDLYYSTSQDTYSMKMSQNIIKECLSPLNIGRGPDWSLT